MEEQLREKSEIIAQQQGVIDRLQQIHATYEASFRSLRETSPKSASPDLSRVKFSRETDFNASKSKDFSASELTSPVIAANGKQQEKQVTLKVSPLFLE